MSQLFSELFLPIYRATALHPTPGVLAPLRAAPPAATEKTGREYFAQVRGNYPLSVIYLLFTETMFHKKEKTGQPASRPVPA